MLVRLRDWFGYRWLIFRSAVGFEKFLAVRASGEYIPKWSQLNTIGKSRAVSMTALVPFIGSYILFNKSLYEYLGLVPEASRPGAFLALSTSERLYILYFGLCLLGIASIIFKASCPTEIKNFGSLHEFVVAERPLSTVPRLTMMNISIAEHYLKYRTISIEEETRIWQQIGFSENLWNITYQAFNKIAHQVAEEIEDIRGDDEEATDFFDHRDNTNLGRWMNVIACPPTVMRSVANTFYQKSASHDIDVLSIYYLSLDQRRPFLRIFVSVLYASGFMLLSVPTISTFSSIFRASISG